MPSGGGGPVPRRVPGSLIVTVALLSVLLVLTVITGTGQGWGSALRPWLWVLCSTIVLVIAIVIAIVIDAWRRTKGRPPADDDSAGP